MRVFKLNSNHLAERCAWLNHPNVYSHMNMQYPITLAETVKWYERVLTNGSRMDFVFEHEEKIVAMSGLTNLDTSNGLVEFYIMVRPDAQGQGYGLRATIFTLNYAFLTYNIHKVYLYTNSFNERANNLYLKLGFHLEGTLRKHKFKNGKLIDRCIYGLLRQEWAITGYAKDVVEVEI